MNRINCHSLHKDQAKLLHFSMLYEIFYRCNIIKQNNVNKPSGAAPCHHRTPAVQSRVMTMLCNTTQGLHILW